MASDLATALLSGQGAGLAADPMTAGIIPQISSAQEMMNQGMSGAPAYPMQAIGRLASVLAGVKMMNDATGDLSHVYGGATESLKRVFPEGTTLGDMLRSDNPYVRMMGLSQASKAALLNSENKTLGPEQTVVTPRTSSAGGVPVAAGSPALAGATEAAKNPAMIARAGGEAKAKAPYEAGGEITVPGGPSGVQTIPATAETRARMQPKVPAAGAAPKPSTEGAPLPYEYQKEPPAAKKPQQPASPGTFDDRFGAAFPGGKPVATPEYEGRIELEKGTNEDFVKNSAKTYESANNLMGRLTTMDHNIDVLGPKWMGAGANAKGEFGNAWNSMLDSAGIKGFHIDPNKIATWQEFNKESTRAGMELIKSNFGGSREAASIIQMGANAVPSAQQSYLGAKYNLASIRAATQREIDLHEYKTGLLQQGKSLVGADVQFNKMRPPEEYAMRGIIDAIPASAKKHLVANPELAADFDKKYGRGMAERIIAPDAARP